MNYTVTHLRNERDRLKKAYINKKVHGYEHGMERIRELNEAIDILSDYNLSKSGCGVIHSTDLNGKCFNCGKQIFERHTH